MHLRNVEIFCDVVAHRSFSRAAEAVGVSQSSASTAVGALEKRLGTQLLDRSKRPLELTPAGRVYFDGCRRMLEQYRKVEDRVREMNDVIAGRVRVAAIYSVGLLQMARYVKSYRELYPDVDLQLDYLHPDDVYARVQNDEADLGLVSFPRDGGDISSTEWQQQPMVLIVAADHRLAGRKRVSVSELDSEPFATFTSDLKIRRKLDRWLKDAGVSVRIVHEFDNIENIKRAVEIGSSVAVLPEPTVQRELEMKTLRAIALSDVAWMRPLGIVHRRHKSLSLAAEKLIELLLGNGSSQSNGAAKNGRTNGARARTGARVT